MPTELHVWSPRRAGRTRPYAVAAGALAGLLLFAGCSNAGDSGATTATPGAAGSSATTAVPDGGPTGTGPVTRPPDPVATDVPTVTRAGGSGAQLSATAAAFTAPVEYSDGVKLTVTSMTQGTSSEQGAGSFPGSPRTALTLQVTNGSNAPIDLNDVVVTMTYGSPARVASPVYEQGAADFSGTVQPGSSTTATYMFSVPKDSLGDVTLSVDFDGGHVAATFKGSVV